MLGNIKSNKTVWIVIGSLIIIALALITFFSVQQKPFSAASEKIIKPEQTTAQNPANDATTEQQLTEEQLAQIAKAAVDDHQKEFTELVDDSILTQPVPNDPALAKDELGQLKEIQSQLGEQKNMLEQQHKDADQLLELKEQQLKALEQQLAS